MKVIKVYDDAHQGVKVEAAKSGRTTSNVASALIRHGLRLVEAGKLDLTADPEPAEKRKVKAAK